MEYIEVSAKTVEDALTEASVKLGTTSDKLEYEIIEKGSTGFLGIGSKNAVIKVKVKNNIEDDIREFLSKILTQWILKLKLSLRQTLTIIMLKSNLKVMTWVY